MTLLHINCPKVFQVKISNADSINSDLHYTCISSRENRDIPTPICPHIQACTTGQIKVGTWRGSQKARAGTVTSDLQYGP